MPTLTPKDDDAQSCATVQTPLHPEQIKALIRMRGITMSDLSRSWGYTESAIRHTLKAPWPRLERLIARFLGIKPQQIWPDRYDARGRSLHLGRRPAK